MTAVIFAVLRNNKVWLLPVESFLFDLGHQIRVTCQFNQELCKTSLTFPSEEVFSPKAASCVWTGWSRLSRERTARLYRRGAENVAVYHICLPGRAELLLFRLSPEEK